MAESPEVKIRRRARAGKMDPREAAEALYGKPISDWDDEELAHGMPRRSDGSFGGSPPKWLTEEVEAEAERRFRAAIRTHLKVSSLSATKIVTKLMEDESTDGDGKFKVAAGVRLNAATYLIDQVVGKATQPVDVSAELKMSSLLAGVVINPGDQPSQGFEEWDSTAQEVDPERDDDEDLAGG